MGSCRTSCCNACQRAAEGIRNRADNMDVWMHKGIFTLCLQCIWRFGPNMGCQQELAGLPAGVRLISKQ